MFAPVQTFHQPAEKLDELTTLTRDQLAAAPPPGLSGFYFLIDRENEKALLISLWETRTPCVSWRRPTPRRGRTSERRPASTRPRPRFSR
jgi:hypothetical protein